MRKWTSQDISEFQKLYSEEHGVALNEEEASVRITALVELIALAIEVEQSKQPYLKQNNPNASLSELD